MPGVGGSLGPGSRPRPRAALVTALTGPATGMGGSGETVVAPAQACSAWQCAKAQRTQWICAHASGGREVRSSLEVTIRCCGNQAWVGRCKNSVAARIAANLPDLARNLDRRVGPISASTPARSPKRDAMNVATNSGARRQIKLRPLRCGGIVCQPGRGHGAAEERTPNPVDLGGVKQRRLSSAHASSRRAEPGCGRPGAGAHGPHEIPATSPVVPPAAFFGPKMRLKRPGMARSSTSSGARRPGVGLGQGPRRGRWAPTR